MPNVNPFNTNLAFSIWNILTSFSKTQKKEQGNTLVGSLAMKEHSPWQKLDAYAGRKQEKKFLILFLSILNPFLMPAIGRSQQNPNNGGNGDTFYEGQNPRAQSRTKKRAEGTWTRITLSQTLLSRQLLENSKSLLSIM